MQVVLLGEDPAEADGLDHVALQQPDQLGPHVGRLRGRVHGRALYRRPISLITEVIGAPRNQACAAGAPRRMTRSGPTGATR